MTSPEWQDHELHGQTLRYWLNFLTTDRDTGEDTGHLIVPCSRYGRTTREVAPWAIACEIIYVEANGANDEDSPRDALQFYMSLVVNDSPDPAELVRSYRYAVPACIKAFSTKAGEDACIAEFVAAHDQPVTPAQPSEAAQCGGK